MRRPVPQEIEKKTRGLFIRLSDDDKRLLEHLAKEDRVTQPALVRHLIREYGRIHAQPKKPASRPKA